MKVMSNGVQNVVNTRCGWVTRSLSAYKLLAACRSTKDTLAKILVAGRASDSNKVKMLRISTDTEQACTACTAWTAVYI